LPPPSGISCPTSLQRAEDVYPAEWC
jgi:hypothetical protein